MQTTNANKPFHFDIISDEQNFDKVYLDHYGALYRYAFNMLNDGMLAEEMVHLVFMKILERNEPLAIHTSIKAYLYRAVNNECLNYIKHQKIKQAYEAHTQNTTSHHTESPLAKTQYRELEAKLHKAINDLPEQCRTIFQLSRFEDLKYAEIANQLGLSIKTVETQMSRALKKLRLQLAEYLPMMIWACITLLYHLIKC